MDRLIVVYKKNSEDIDVKLNDEKQGANLIVLKADLNGLLICNSDEEQDAYISKFDTDEYESVVANSKRDIDALREAYYLIDGWDIEKGCFIINGTEKQLIYAIMSSKTQRLEQKYSSNRILRSVIIGEDEWAKEQLKLGEEKMQAIRDEYNMRVDEYNKIVAVEQSKQEAEGDYGDIT